MIHSYANTLNTLYNEHDSELCYKFKALYGKHHLQTDVLTHVSFSPCCPVELCPTAK